MISYCQRWFECIVLQSALPKKWMNSLHKLDLKSCERHKIVGKNSSTSCQYRFHIRTFHDLKYVPILNHYLTYYAIFWPYSANVLHQSVIIAIKLSYKSWTGHLNSIYGWLFYAQWIKPCIKITRWKYLLRKPISRTRQQGWNKTPKPLPLPRWSMSKSVSVNQ